MIPLYLENGVAYVWNSEDWYILRTKHRICGSLIGSLPSFPRQNDFQGLPMALMSEEAALLINEGICELYDTPNMTQKVSNEIKQQVDEIENRVTNEQAEALKRRKIEQIAQKIDIILTGKRQKLLSKGIADIDLDKNILLQEEINKVPNIAPSNLLIHLPTEHYYDTGKTKVSLDALNPSITEGKGVIKYAVFEDLWKKGFYITNGSKFGSDFLIYPGDPVRFHATYMLKCTNVETTFRAASLVAFGRLSVGVNKLGVLAYFNGLNEIEYQTLQWHDSVNV
ncbi:tRNA-splicing endonuclease subunit Sen34 [Colias croceus]|uniref:tRNA-splicing endonuclease subunit Sen34 n=1 Tax=Colias crocea TaxID=72248 RepID=UPI001E27FD1B|nr:tRNA-splicing endonuclease subunit Sen34 [Colias croceus]